MYFSDFRRLKIPQIKFRLTPNVVLLGSFLVKIKVKNKEKNMENRVKELREYKHLTQIGLALKIRSTQQTISKVEKGMNVPRLDLALNLADFFNVSLEYLFCLSDKKHKIEYQIEIDRAIEEYYDFFVEYQELNCENRKTIRLLMRRFLEVQKKKEKDDATNSNM